MGVLNYGGFVNGIHLQYRNIFLRQRGEKYRYWDAPDFDNGKNTDIGIHQILIMEKIPILGYTKFRSNSHSLYKVLLLSLTGYFALQNRFFG